MDRLVWPAAAKFVEAEFGVTPYLKTEVGAEYNLSSPGPGLDHAIGDLKRIVQIAKPEMIIIVGHSGCLGWHQFVDPDVEEEAHRMALSGAASIVGRMVAPGVKLAVGYFLKNSQVMKWWQLMGRLVQR
ncbi:MAG: hypothetical protein Q8R13_05735 [bacterium]|nr:hypothetical protein [bacterium]MDZ4296356.1 hypothetical protein [Patescibacteria group bacterium]